MGINRIFYLDNILLIEVSFLSQFNHTDYGKNIIDFFKFTYNVYKPSDFLDDEKRPADPVYNLNETLLYFGLYVDKDEFQAFMKKNKNPLEYFKDKNKVMTKLEVFYTPIPNSSKILGEIYDFKTKEEYRGQGQGGKLIDSLFDIDIGKFLDTHKATMGAYWTGLLFENEHYDKLMKFYIRKELLPMDAIGYLTPTNKLLLKGQLQSLSWGKNINPNLQGHCMGGSVVTPFLSLYYIYDKRRKDTPSQQKSLDVAKFLKKVYDKLMVNKNLCVCITPGTVKI